MNRNKSETTFVTGRADLLYCKTPRLPRLLDHRLGIGSKSIKLKS
jgi:hypothetical protein